MSTRDPTTQAAVAFLWHEYRANGHWPSRKDFLLYAHDSGFEVDALAGSSLISLRAGDGNEVRPAFEALLALPDVRDLLAPLPTVLRQAAAAFATDALKVPDNRLPTLHFRDVKEHWLDHHQAKAAFDVLRSTSSGLFAGGGSSGTDPEDFWFSLGINTLRFEHVQTLDEVLLLWRVSRVGVAVLTPREKHLELLRRIHRSSKREQRWPQALAFAITNRELGYVPALVNELNDRFVRGDFQPYQSHSLVLTTAALPYVDPSGDDRALLVEAVRTAVALWRSRSGDIHIPLAELAAALHVTPEQLGPVVAFLDSSKWCHLSHVEGDAHLNQLLVLGDPERVLRNESVRTFDEYIAIWQEDEHSSGVSFASGPTSAIHSPSEAGTQLSDEGEVAAALGAAASTTIAAAPANRRAASNPRFRYDVAISFAGPQRQAAETLARAVRNAGFEVFFDGFYKEDLWGKDLTVYFDEVFRKESRFCVIFVSGEYASRMWTTRERQSALARTVKERGQEYILPVQVEDIEIPGLLPTVGYVSLASHTIEEVADILVKKLQAVAADAPPA